MAKAAKKAELTHPHPGEILAAEFLEPRAIAVETLAAAIDVPARRLKEIIAGKRAITADTALRLSRYFGLSERYWLNLQTCYDLEVEKDRLEGRLEQEVRVFSAPPFSPTPA